MRHLEAEVGIHQGVEAVAIERCERDVARAGRVEDAGERATGTALPDVVQPHVELVAGTPEHGGVTARDVVLVEHEHRASAPCQQTSSHQAADAGADDDHVEVIALEAAETIGTIRSVRHRDSSQSLQWQDWRGVPTLSSAMSRKTADRYHHGDLRRALVDAALEVVAERGTGALGLREVARRVGVSHAAPTHHFADKAALIAAVGARAFGDLADAMNAAAAAAGNDAVARLKAAGVAYVRFAAERPALFRLMFGGELASVGDPALKRESRRAFDVLLDAASGVAGAGASPDQVELVVTTAWSVVHGLSLLWLDGHLGRRSRGGGKAGILRAATRVTDLVARAVQGA